MENLPIIVQIAAWIYVIKQILPIVILVLLLPISYIGLLWANDGDRKKTNAEFIDSFLKGINEALDSH